MVNRRESVMMRLIQACRELLTERGMAGIFVDGVRSDDESSLESLGGSYQLPTAMTLLTVRQGSASGQNTEKCGSITKHQDQTMQFTTMNSQHRHNHDRTCCQDRYGTRTLPLNHRSVASDIASLAPCVSGNNRWISSYYTLYLPVSTFLRVQLSLLHWMLDNTGGPSSPSIDSTHDGERASRHTPGRHVSFTTGMYSTNQSSGHSYLPAHATPSADVTAESTM